MPLVEIHRRQSIDDTVIRSDRQTLLGAGRLITSHSIAANAEVVDIMGTRALLG